MKAILIIASFITCNFINAQVNEYIDLNTDTSLLSPQYNLKSDVTFLLRDFDLDFDIVLPFWLYYSAVKNTMIDTIGLKWILDRHGIDSTTQAFYCTNHGEYYSASIAIVPKITKPRKPYRRFEELKLIYYQYSWEIVEEGVIIEYPDGTKIKTAPMQDTVYDEICITIVPEPENREAISIQKQRISKENRDKYLRFIVKYDKAVPLPKE